MDIAVNKTRGLRGLIAPRSFYVLVLSVALPIILQNAITNFVGMLDNIMVGKLGTQGDEMSGVTIVNQLMMVFNITIFGAISGAGIFGAQFFGKGDLDGLKNCFRFKLYISLIICGIGIIVFRAFGENLISLYLVEGEVGDIGLAKEFGKQYLWIMLFGLLPFALVQTYASTLRETGKTVLPMIAGIIAMLTNCILNFILIFGYLGAPALGVRGAAIATVISRVVEALIILTCAHYQKKKYQFTEHLYRSFKIPLDLVKKIAIMGSPLLVNELLWSLGQAVLNMQYAQRGQEVINGINIASTLHGLFCIFMLAMGNVVAILVGQELGKGALENAKLMAKQLLFFSFVITILIAAGLFSVSSLFPKIYNVPQISKDLASTFIRILAIALPMQTVLNSSYFIIRSGGKTVITFFFDSGYAWVVTLPLCFCLVSFTSLSVVVIYAIVTFSEVIKLIVGLVMVNKGIWLQNIVK